MSLEAAFEIGRLYPLLKSISDTLTSSKDKIFLELPGLVGWFPGGAIGQTGEMYNVVNNTLPMLQTGTCIVGYDGHPYRQTGGGTNFLFRSAFAGLTGTEAYIDATMRGFTIGGWLFMNSFNVGVAAGMISKDGIAANRGYLIFIQPSGQVAFQVSVDGTSNVNVFGSIIGLGSWHFIAARFTPSTEIAIFVDGVKVINTTSIPAAAFVSTQNFEVGRYFNSTARIMSGRVRDVFVCQAALSDSLINEIMQTSTV